MIGKMVEIHLLNGKRFLGKITVKDNHGLVLYCIPVKALETVPPGKSAYNQMREMLHTVFFPWQQIEYVDIGGEPIGFDSLYTGWFQGKPVADFFTKSTESVEEREKRNWEN